jgi:hypothetical protein
MQFPSGKYGIVGRVPVALTHESRHGTPQMPPNRVTKTWDTEQEVIDALLAEGITRFQLADCSWYAPTPTPRQETHTMQYSNPRMHVIVEDWPWGSDLRTTATFRVEVHPTRGERAARTTLDPKTGRISAPHRLTYAHSVCFVDGDDGKLYILEDTGNHYSIMKGTMAHQQETVFPQDGERYAALTFLFNQLDQQRAATEEEQTMPAEQPEQPTEAVKIVSKKVRVRKMATAVPANGGESKIAMREAASEDQEPPTSAHVCQGCGAALHSKRAVMCVHCYVAANGASPAPLATEAELDAIFGQEAPSAVVEREPQASVDELPAPTPTIREMTVDTDNRIAYRAELVSREEDGTRLVPTWTSAPVDYDGFGTVTVEADCGVYCGKPIRKVETPLKHLNWQRDRYGSGLHTAASAVEWNLIQASPGYARENSQNLLAVVDTQPLAQALETLKTHGGETVPPQAAVPRKARAATPAKAPKPQASDFDTKERVEAKVQYLLDLATQGEGAIRTALQAQDVSVRLKALVAAGLPAMEATGKDAPAKTEALVQGLLALGHQGAETLRTALRTYGIIIRMRALKVAA